MTCSALAIAMVSVSAAAGRDDVEEYHFQKAIPKALEDAVSGWWRHEYASEINGRVVAPQQVEVCLTAADQQQMADGAAAAFNIGLWGGCYGSVLLDTPEELRIVEHCDATAAVNQQPAMAGFTSTFRITRARSPQDRWEMDVVQPNLHFRSTFTRLGDCPASRTGGQR